MGLRGDWEQKDKKRTCGKLDERNTPSLTTKSCPIAEEAGIRAKRKKSGYNKEKGKEGQKFCKGKGESSSISFRKMRARKREKRSGGVEEPLGERVKTGG